LLTLATDLTHTKTHVRKISVLGLHPAIDVINPVGLAPVRVAGGNAVNVTRSAHTISAALGFSPRLSALGYIATDLEAEYRKAIAATGAEMQIKGIDGTTRVNRYHRVDGQEQCIRGTSGYHLENQQIHTMYRMLEDSNPGDIVVVTGSQPPGLPADFYTTAVRILKDRGVYTVLDAPVGPLKQVFASDVRPDMVKPNREEAKGLAGRRRLDSNSRRLNVWKQILPHGEAICSLGAQGFWVRERTGRAWRLRLPFPEGLVPLTRVGCGDSAVGAIVACLSVDMPLVDAVQWAISASVANTTTTTPGDFPLELLRDLYDQVEIKQAS